VARNINCISGQVPFPEFLAYDEDRKAIASTPDDVNTPVPLVKKSSTDLFVIYNITYTDTLMKLPAKVHWNLPYYITSLSATMDNGWSIKNGPKLAAK